MVTVLPAAEEADVPGVPAVREHDTERVDAFDEHRRHVVGLNLDLPGVVRPPGREQLGADSHAVDGGLVETQRRRVEASPLGRGGELELPAQVRAWRRVRQGRLGHLVRLDVGDPVRSPVAGRQARLPGGRLREGRFALSVLHLDPPVVTRPGLQRWACIDNVHRTARPDEAAVPHRFAAATHADPVAGLTHPGPAT